MSLTQRLDNLRRASAKKFPEEARATMHAATEALRASGQADRATGDGDTAPDFTLDDSQRNAVSLAGLREQGAVVLTFFRGHW